MGHQRRFYTGTAHVSWWLYRDDAGEVSILQEGPNSEVIRLEIGAFLNEACAGPEHQALIQGGPLPE